MGCSAGSTGSSAGGVRRVRLHARLQAPVVFVVGATGAGKSTLVRHALDEDGASARIVTVGRDWQRPEVAARMLAEATRGRPASLAIDDAHHLICSAHPAVSARRRETAGWAEPIRLLARMAERVDPD